MTRDACITKDYLAYEQPKMDEPVSLYAGDDNTSVLNINERKKTFEVALILELTWVDDRIKVDFSGPNDKRRLPSIKKNVQPYIWIPWFEIINKCIEYYTSIVKESTFEIPQINCNATSYLDNSISHNF